MVVPQGASLTEHGETKGFRAQWQAAGEKIDQGIEPSAMNTLLKPAR
jgi:hypothetical protein